MTYFTLSNMKILGHWLMLALAILAVPFIVPGIHVDSILTAIVVAAVLGFINFIIKPVVTILTLPINILTLGLFSLVLNGLFFWFVAQVISGFSVETFTAAILGALLVSVINWIGNKIFVHD